MTASRWYHPRTTSLRFSENPLIPNKNSCGKASPALTDYYKTYINSGLCHSQSGLQMRINVCAEKNTSPKTHKQLTHQKHTKTIKKGGNYLILKEKPPLHTHTHTFTHTLTHTHSLSLSHLTLHCQS